MTFRSATQTSRSHHRRVCKNTECKYFYYNNALTLFFCTLCPALIFLLSFWGTVTFSYYNRTLWHFSVVSTKCEGTGALCNVSAAQSQVLDWRTREAVWHFRTGPKSEIGGHQGLAATTWVRHDEGSGLNSLGWECYNARSGHVIRVWWWCTASLTLADCVAQSPGFLWRQYFSFVSGDALKSALFEPHENHVVDTWR